MYTYYDRDRVLLGTISWSLRTSLRQQGRRSGGGKRPYQTSSVPWQGTDGGWTPPSLKKGGHDAGAHRRAPLPTPVRTATTDAGPPPCRPLFGQLPPTLVRIGGPPCRPMWCAGRLVVVKWWTRSFFSIPTKRQSTSSAHLQGHCHRTGAIDRNARMR